MSIHRVFALIECVKQDIVRLCVYTFCYCFDIVANGSQRQASEWTKKKRINITLSPWFCDIYIYHYRSYYHECVWRSTLTLSNGALSCYHVIAGRCCSHVQLHGHNIWTLRINVIYIIVISKIIHSADMGSHNGSI